MAGSQGSSDSPPTKLSSVPKGDSRFRGTAVARGFFRLPAGSRLKLRGCGNSVFPFVLRLKLGSPCLFVLHAAFGCRSRSRSKSRSGS